MFVKIPMFPVFTPMNPPAKLPSACSFPRLLPAVTAALAAAGLIGTAQAQIQVAGTLLVNIDATSTSLGSLPNIPNAGSLGGFFEARSAGETPVVAIANGNGTRGVRFDGNDYLVHVASLGGALVPADATLVGVNPTCTIEAWVLNPSIAGEETVVSWGRRGGPNGSNKSLNYGFDDRWGAIGHWGTQDIGWDSCCDSGSNPPGVPASGVWHHLVWTFDGTTTRVYADGVLKNSESLGLNTTAGTPVTIGAQWEADGVTVTGGLRATMLIARVRVHSEALSGTQVLGNYNFERGGFSNGGAPLPFGPSHRWSFNNGAGAAANGTVVNDSIGTAHGTVRGAGATFTGAKVTLPGGSSATQAYVDLPNGLLSVNSADNGGSGGVTIEGWARVTGAPNWGRLFDFGSSDIDPSAALLGGEVPGPGGVGGTSGEGMDYIFMSATEGTNPNRRTGAIRNIDPPTGSDLGIAWDTGTFARDFHYAMTWDEAAGLMRFYENGSEVTTLGVNPATDRMSRINDVNVWLGRSNWTGDANMQGEHDEFRIYPRVVPPEQIKASYDAGPNNLATADPVSIGTQPQNQIVTEFGNASFSIVALGYPPLGYQWYRVPATAIPGANASSYQLSSIPLSEHGAQFFCVASNFIPGTGSFFATSQVATLTVNADLVPPALLSAAAAGGSNIVVTFSETINAADAANAMNFSVSAAGTNVAVLEAAAAGPNRARLTLGAPLGCAYYVVTVSGVRDVATAQNVILPGSQAGFLSLAGPTLLHRYTFNNDPAANAIGAFVPDVAGTAHAEVKGTTSGASFTGTRVTLGGGASATAPYVDLPNGLLSVNSTNNGGSGKLTFEGWVKVTGVQSWARILDIGSTVGGEVNAPGGGGQGLDYLFYSAMNGSDRNVRRIDFTNLDPTDEGAVGQDYVVSNFGQDIHFVITWDEATGEIKVYEGGALKASVTTDDPMSDINDVNVWLGRSNWTVDSNMQGEFDEFRIYNRVLAQNEITQNTGVGPDAATGAPQSITVNVASTNMSFPGPSQQATAVVGFAGGLNLDLTASGCIQFESSDPTVLTVSPAGVLSVVTGGVATVTARFNGLVGSRVISVIEDTNGPTLVSARVNSPTAIEIGFSEVVDVATATDNVNYTVYGPDGVVPVNTIQLHPSQDRVTLNLLGRLPCGRVTVEVNLVADTAPRMNEIAPNSRISTYYLVVNGLSHRYSFNEFPTPALPGSIVPDLAGDADGDVKGGNGTFLGSRVRLGGGASSSAAYVDLPNGLLSVNSTNRGGPGGVTLEAWVKVTGAQIWSRIFDIGSSEFGPEVPGPGGGGAGLDYLMVSATIGTDTANRRTELRNEDPPGGGIHTVDHAASGLNVDTHVALTWDEATGVIRTYQNGAQVSSMTVNDAISDINDVNVWLGRSNWTGDSNMQGEFDEFRVHRRVMPAAEVAFSYSLGADANVGTLNSVTVSGPSTIEATRSAQLTVLGIFSNVPGLDLSGTLCVRYTSSNPSVLTVSPTGVAQGVRCGSAVVTAWIAGAPEIVGTLAISVSNCPPVVGPDGGATAQNQAVTLPFAKLLRNDTDPEGAPVSFHSASGTSTNGGLVVAGPNSVTYTPQPGFTGVDRFQYTVTDGVTTGFGFVEILVVDGNLPSQNQVSLTSNDNGGYVVRFAGIPGRTYRVERATALAGPWSVVATLVAPLHGIIQYEDASPPQPNAFYRTSVLP